MISKKSDIKEHYLRSYRVTNIAPEDKKLVKRIRIRGEVSEAEVESANPPGFVCLRDRSERNSPSRWKPGDYPIKVL